MKSGPRSLQLKKALAQKRRPNIAINQSINKKSLKKKTTMWGVGEEPGMDCLFNSVILEWLLLGRPGPAQSKHTEESRPATEKASLIMHSMGLPWWCSGWESACQCRGHGLEPWPGKIPHAAEKLGPWATTTEPARLEPVLGNKRGRDSERPAHRDEEWPPLAATRESPRRETETQHSHK